MTKKRFDFCVLDSAPLLTGSLSADLSEVFVTVPAVIEEIRDEASRQRLANLPFTLKTRNPSPEAVALVNRFARATGDVAVLSATDLQVVALAVTLELEENGDASKIRRNPEELPSSVTHGGETASTVLVSHKKQQKPKKKTGGIEVSDFEDDVPAINKLAQEFDEKAQVDDGADSEGEWITPENIKHVLPNGEIAKKKKKKNKNKNKTESTTESVSQTNTPAEVVPAEPAVELKKIACLTADFAMQNVLLRMRCMLYTADGVRVKSLKNWLLRCHACFATTFQMDVRFCPKCGGPTLRRTSYSIDHKGAIHVYLSADFQNNLRGTKYSITVPKGGREGSQLILREDQKEHIKQREHYERVQNKLQKQQVDFEEVLEDRIAAMFGASSGPGKNRRYDQYDGMAPPVVGYGRKNPNVPRKKV